MDILQIHQRKKKNFFLEIELFGIWVISHNIEIKENFFIIKIEGEKKMKLNENVYEFQNYIPNNYFILEIKVENSKGIVNDEPKTEEENGLYILIFTLRNKNVEEEVISGESDENEDV